MRVGVVGGGPAGLTVGIGLARRGHHVVVVDRDPGPGGSGQWVRHGVMQFGHAHAFRQPVLDIVTEQAPAVARAWHDAGAEAITVTLPNGVAVPVGVRSQRATFERALRTAAATQPGLNLVCGHVDAVCDDDGRARGIVVDGERVDVDLVIDAAGRAARAMRPWRPALTVGGPCGIAYVDRQYRLLPGAEPGPMSTPVSWQADLDGYQVLVIPHEQGVFSVLIIRAASDKALAELRHAPAFEAACAAIPGLADWVRPDRSRPITPVLPGGALHNAFRSQSRPDGQLAMPGLVFLGDAVATTTPNFGRGITITMWQVQQLLQLIDKYGDDVTAVGQVFDTWTVDTIKPWVDDHIHMDDATRRSWEGDTDLDLDGPLPSNLILAAAEAAPHIRQAAAAYLAMAAPPSSLLSVEPAARELYASGWRPSFDAGPTRDELARLIASAAA